MFPDSHALSSAAPSGLVTPDLCHMQCMVLSFFAPGTILLILSFFRVFSRPCTNLANLMHPSFETYSLLHSPSHESAPGADCLPLVCASLWFRPLSLDSYWHISLASCAFKHFEHLICARIGSHFSTTRPFLGGFRWGADAMVFSFVRHFALPFSRTHIFRVHRHSESIDKALTPAWSKLTFVRFFDFGVTGSLCTSSPISCVEPCPRHVLVVPSLHPGSTNWQSRCHPSLCHPWCFHHL